MRSIQTRGSISDYLELLTHASQVQHQVLAPFDKRPLLALQVDTPLRRVHRLMAANYQLTWKASPANRPAYSLVESADDQRARARALAAAHRKGRQQVQARFDQVRRLAFLSPEELKRLSVAGDPKTLTLQHPRTSAMTRLLFSLPGETWSQFWHAGTARVRVSALAPELQALAIAAAGDGMAGPEGGEKCRIADLVVPQGKISLQLGGTVERPAIRSVMQYGPPGNHTNLLYAEGTTREPPQERRAQVRRAPSKVPPDPRFPKSVTLKDQSRPKIHLELGERPPNSRPLAEYLLQLEKQVDLPIIAECDYRPKDAAWLRQQWWLADDIVKRPLSEALDLLCADFEFEWQFREGALLLRPKRWFVPANQQGYVYPKQDPPERQIAAA